MGTAIAEQPKHSTADKVITYVPLGGKTSVELTMGMVKKFLCVPTRNGNIASDSDIVKFMMLCKARELDPWVGDAYLVGYDSNDGPVFSLITSAQALLKRSEISPEYDGMESGVIVTSKDGVVTYREGDLVLDSESLVGGWARCHRKDRQHPSFDALKLSTFTTGKSRWAKDPAGMIVKCAESSALRKAFPTQLGGLYSKDEMDHLSDTRIESRAAGSVSPMVTASSLDQLAASIEKEFKPPQPTLPERFAACKTHKEALKLRDDICDPESTATEDEIAAAGVLYDSWVKDHEGK
jgi:phage recombination protein Bet